MAAIMPIRTTLAGAAVILASSLCGCFQYASSDPGLSSDPSVRHPIVLASAPATLDVYPVGGRLDARTRSELRAFAERYRRFGSGGVLILTAGRSSLETRAAQEVRSALAADGVSGRVAVSLYGLEDAYPPPIRVAFMGLKAVVPTPCGRWPDDLASGSSLEGWKNEAWANFGCATQATIAAQVEDPRDFVQERALGPSDVEMRTRAIEAVRNGHDPGTDWHTTLTPIGGVGGSN